MTRKEGRIEDLKGRNPKAPREAVEKL